MFSKSNIPRYKKWRKIGKKLNDKIIEKIPKEVILQAAKDLRMLGKRNFLIFDSEDETSYLMDRAIYDIKTGGGICLTDVFSPERKLFLNEKKICK